MTSLALTACTITAGNALTPGDIAIVGFNFDNPDSIAFVALTDFDAGTEIKFTDNGWTKENAFRTGENTSTYLADNPVTAGTILSIEPNGLSGQGDQVLAYQGTVSEPSFIYALNSEGTGWQDDADSANTSAIPFGLTDGQTAVAFNEIDNGFFDTSVLNSGTKAQWIEAIATPDNWTFSNSALPLPSGSISVTAPVPEPATYATILGAAAFAIIVLRRKSTNK